MKKEKKRNYKKIILISITVVLGVYLIGLANPLTGPSLRLPYYSIYCGKKPVIASNFMGMTYYTENMGYEYRADYNDKLYCTEQEAVDRGYKKGTAPQ